MHSPRNFCVPPKVLRVPPEISAFPQKSYAFPQEFIHSPESPLRSPGKSSTLGIFPNRRRHKYSILLLKRYSVISCSGLSGVTSVEGKFGWLGASG